MLLYIVALAVFGGRQQVRGRDVRRDSAGAVAEKRFYSVAVPSESVPTRRRARTHNRNPTIKVASSAAGRKYTRILLLNYYNTSRFASVYYQYNYYSVYFLPVCARSSGQIYRPVKVRRRRGEPVRRFSCENPPRDRRRRRLENRPKPSGISKAPARVRIRSSRWSKTTS